MSVIRQFIYTTHCVCISDEVLAWLSVWSKVKMMPLPLSYLLPQLKYRMILPL